MTCQAKLYDIILCDCPDKVNTFSKIVTGHKCLFRKEILYAVLGDKILKCVRSQYEKVQNTLNVKNIWIKNTKKSKNLEKKY